MPHAVDRGMLLRRNPLRGVGHAVPCNILPLHDLPPQQRAPVVAWFSVRGSAFRILSGNPARFASSGHGERSFCPRCGTQLTFRSRLAGDEIDITTASLDDPEAVPPLDQTWAASRLHWMPPDARPAFAHGRSGSA